MTTTTKRIVRRLRALHRAGRLGFNAHHTGGQAGVALRDVDDFYSAFPTNQEIAQYYRAPISGSVETERTQAIEAVRSLLEVRAMRFAGTDDVCVGFQLWSVRAERRNNCWQHELAEF